MAFVLGRKPQRLVLCRCDWQGPVHHYHIRGGNHRSFTPAQLEKLCGVAAGWYAGALVDARMDEELDRDVNVSGEGERAHASLRGC
jgi:hypothetical protein